MKPKLIFILFLLFCQLASSQEEVISLYPGGAFQFLSIDSEGYKVARWLKMLGF
jgi:hypothetical protein